MLAQTIIDQVAGGTADQHRQAAPHSRRVDRDETDRHHRGKRDPAGEIGAGLVVGRDAGGAVDGDRREHEADGGHDGARDHRRHQPLDPAVACHLHHEADEEIERAGRDDAAERQGDVRVRAADARARGDQHRADEGEARAEIARHPAADHEEEDQRREAREQDRDIGVEAHQDRRQHRRAEHGDHVLQAQNHHLAGRQPLVRHDDAFGLQAPSWQETVAHQIPQAIANSAAT